MATRGRPMGKLHQDDVRAKRFFVYELVASDGAVHYVGKGSGRRLAVQQKRYGLAGRIVERFSNEEAAYKFEVAHIQKVKPLLNKHRGGNGCRATPYVEPKDAFIDLCRRLGVRVVAARMALTYGCDPSKRDALRLVAYG